MRPAPHTTAADRPDTTGPLSALVDHPVCVTLAAVFDAAGHELYLVGGCVRDALTAGFAATGQTSPDLDFTTDARPEQIRAAVDQLGPIWDAGERFGTIGVIVAGEKVEITTFRTEAYEPDSRKPTVAYGDTVAQDLARRDLTVNALAISLTDAGPYRRGELVDLFGGADDLAAGIARTPDDANKTVVEDPLRQLRAVRFAATRGLRLDAHLIRAITRHADRLDIVARERCTAELVKILDQGPAATTQALALAVNLGVTHALLGPLAPSSTRQLQDATTALAAEDLRDADLATVLAVLAVAGGQDSTQARRSVRALRLPGEVADTVAAILQVLEVLAGTDDLPVLRLARTHSPAVLDAARSVHQATGRASDLLGVLALIAAGSPRRGPLPVDGNDLLTAGLTGRAIGAAIRTITDAFVRNPDLTASQALRLAREPAITA